MLGRDKKEWDGFNWGGVLDTPGGGIGNGRIGGGGGGLMTKGFWNFSVYSKNERDNLSSERTAQPG